MRWDIKIWCTSTSEIKPKPNNKKQTQKLKTFNSWTKNMSLNLTNATTNMTYSCIKRGQPSASSLPKSPCLPRHRPHHIGCEKDSIQLVNSSLYLQPFRCISCLCLARPHPRLRKLLWHSCASTFPAGHPSRPWRTCVHAPGPRSIAGEREEGLPTCNQHYTSTKTH